MKIKLNRVFCLLSLLFAVMFTGNAFAAFTFTPELPSSTYSSGGVTWYGESTYSDSGFQSLVQYAVYDTGDGKNEWGYAAPGDGRYIYAYQVFNANSATQDIGYLNLFGAAGHTLTGGEMSGIGSQMDTNSTEFPEQGKKPVSGEFDDAGKKIVWKFLDAGGEFGIIGQGQHSYFLIYSSDIAPVMGSYEVKPLSQSEIPQVPEPATIVLFGTGGLILLRKLRK
jgi:hypothetical protein